MSLFFAAVSEWLNDWITAFVYGEIFSFFLCRWPRLKSDIPSKGRVEIASVSSLISVAVLI